VFASLSDRLAATFKSLRGKGRLSEADIDATVREIRRALLDADVALPVVRNFTAAVRERAVGAEVSQALNPAQQVVQIVHDQLVQVLGGQTRRLQLAKTPPTVILLAGLQGAGKTTLAGKLGRWLREQGHTPLLIACDLQRPNAVDPCRTWECDGISVWSRVTVCSPPVSPRSRSESPGPWPGCIGALPCRFGRAKLDLPSPPYVVPSSENSAVFCEIGISWPSHNAHPTGAKLPANMRISATNGLDMILLAGGVIR